jgi:hypothetical protein
MISCSLCARRSVVARLVAGVSQGLMLAVFAARISSISLRNCLRRSVTSGMGKGVYHRSSGLT